MILDGGTYYQAYDMTRIFGMFIALALTVFVETLIIYYANKKWSIILKEPCILASIVTLANLITFFLGILLFLGGI